jgi:hypothetical protein
MHVRAIVQFQTQSCAPDPYIYTASLHSKLITEHPLILPYVYGRLLSSVVLHHQDLDHSDEDVQEVQL